MSEVNILIAFAAGLVSFLSPCVLPLVPSYLSFVTGASYHELRDGSAPRRALLLRTIGFVLGFSIVFVVLGLLFSGPALLFSGATRWINLVAGTIVVLLGLNMMFDFVAALNVEKRVHTRTRPASVAGATVVGMAFGAGWSPCIGPILASILLLAGTEGSAGRAAVLLGVYSFGLGVPFLATALAFGRVGTFLDRIKPHLNAIRTGAGAFMVGIGLLIATGRFQQINGVLTSAGLIVERWTTAQPLAADIVIGGGFLALALIQPGVALLRKRPILRPVATPVAAGLAVVGLLEITGAVEVGSAIAAWLRFQGV